MGANHDDEATSILEDVQDTSLTFAALDPVAYRQDSTLRIGEIGSLTRISDQERFSQRVAKTGRTSAHDDFLTYLLFFSFRRMAIEASHARRC